MARPGRGSLKIDQQTEAVLRLIGYTVRGIAEECVVSVRGGPTWTIDVASRPVAVRSSAGGSSNLCLQVEPADMERFTTGIDYRVVEAWIDSGRIAISGRDDTVRRFRQRMHAGGVSSGPYVELADWIRNPRFVFMNHGFAELDRDEDFSWVKEEDEPWRYSINLVRHVVDGVDLTGNRVLDVGCGRGGACSCLRRYYQSAHVVGIDLVPANIEFCGMAHPLDGLEFVEGDAQDLPFDDRSFDVVTNIESSHCYPSLARFYAEVRRVLKPGGWFCYADNMDPQADNRHEELLRAAGGTITAQRDITREVAEGSRRWRERVGPAFMREMIDRDGSNAAFVERFGAVLMAVDQIYDSGARVYRSWRVRFGS